MKVSVNIIDKFAILKFEVEQVLGYEGQEFQDNLLSSLDKKIGFVIVDLSNVKFISSWGIGMLMHGLATTVNRGGEFKIACLADNVFEVFKKVKIDTVLKLYETVDLAISDS
jgi:anti-sigma B factor antagonist